MILFGRKIPIVFSLAVWFCLWEIVGHSGFSSIIPPFTSVVQTAFVIAQTDKFAAATAITLRSFSTGMLLAIAIGLPLGFLMARVAFAGRLLGMWVNIFVSAPISALVPLLMAVVGIGETTVVATVFLFAVFVIVLDTQVGVQHADRSLVEMARSFGARRSQIYTKVLILSALPEILAGLRLGAIRGVKGVVIGQLLVSIIGVGELFELYSKHFLMEEFWALVMMVFLFAFAISETLAMLERKVEYYAGSR